MSNWIEVLAEQAKQHGQKAVADKLGLSRTTISQVINRKYPGDLARVQALVEGAYMDKAVACPVLGCLPLNECLIHQANKRTTGSPIRIKLYRACRSGCPNSLYHPGSESPPALPTTRHYDAQGVIRRLTRQADGDKAVLIDLLKAELLALGTKHNRHLKQEPQS
ncbi:helix-turn-helix domain-containing protein [Ferrimonas balearica]|uniref:helix-turn-helix domain-containing protein n=1 Tax=Ferrimonas balearica TaxID=44012 RepID=UPI001C964953|nr:helix-turn-helix transcriptional regulator [Ferrimonas balearica]MBY6223592.1 helix-turn-helix transcriptional regulator [Ferrimonas balearica]